MSACLDVCSLFVHINVCVYDVCVHMCMPVSESKGVSGYVYVNACLHMHMYALIVCMSAYALICVCMCRCM